MRDAIAEKSLDPQNIEAAIRKGLLPRLFTLIGLESAKPVIEQVIQTKACSIPEGQKAANWLESRSRSRP